MASNTCGSVDFLSGGTIHNSNIYDSRISGSTFENGVIKSSSIESLTAIDQASAVSIANALTSLSASQLKDLAEALFAALGDKVSITEGPALSTAAPIPTEIAGNRSSLLGAPDGYAKFGADYVVPVYRP